MGVVGQAGGLAPVQIFRCRPYRYLWSASLLWNNARWADQVALEAVSMNLAKVLGPLAAGGLIAFGGAEAAYLAVTGLFALETALLAVMPMPPRLARPVGGGSVLRYLRQGWEELRLKEPIVGVLLITVCMNMLAFPHQTLLPVFARDVLVVDAVGLGLLGLSGLGQSAFGALQSTIILGATSERLRGRAMGALTVAIGSAPLGLLEIAAVTAAFGAPLAVAANASLCALLTLLIAAGYPRFRDPDSS